MNRFAELLDRLAYEPSRNNKLRLMGDYFGSEADPDRGYRVKRIETKLIRPELPEQKRQRCGNENDGNRSDHGPLVPAKAGIQMPVHRAWSPPSPRRAE